MKRLWTGIFMAMFFLSRSPTHAAVVDDLLNQYRAQGSKPFDPAEGKGAWNRKVENREAGEARSCSGCHGADLRQPGKHLQTGKVIDPMAPSVNSKRLTDPAFIEKWLKRNCQWTFGRPCTLHEKGTFLSFILSQ